MNRAALRTPLTLLLWGVLLLWLPPWKLFLPDGSQRWSLVPVGLLFTGMVGVARAASSSRLRWSMARGALVLVLVVISVLVLGGGSILDRLSPSARPLAILLVFGAGIDVVLALRHGSREAGWQRVARRFMLSALLLMPLGGWLLVTEAGLWWLDRSFTYEPGNRGVEALFLMLNLAWFCGGLLLALSLFGARRLAAGSSPAEGPSELDSPVGP